MAGRGQALPGDDVYLSRRKLLHYSAQLGLETAGPGPASVHEASGGGSVFVPPIKVSAEYARQGERVDPAWEEQRTQVLLRQLVERLGELPDLEEAENVREGGWFRFHRELAFGIVHGDMTTDVRAVVATDATPVLPGLPVTALLMTGAVAHLGEPYASEELRTDPGSRSGSGTDEWFVWLERSRAAREKDPTLTAVDLRELGEGPPQRSEGAFELYWAVGGEEGAASEMPIQQLRRAPCEGVAQASFVAVNEETTLVMGSPLYIRISALPQAEPSDGGVDEVSRSSGWRRLFRRGDQ